LIAFKNQNDFDLMRNIIARSVIAYPRSSPDFSDSRLKKF
jgi:hypothetical protein